MTIERRPDKQPPKGSLEANSPTPSPLYAWLNRYGTRVLLGMTLVILAIAVWRYHSASEQRRVLEAQAALGRARIDLAHLEQTLQPPFPEDPQPVAMRRDQLATQVLSELQEVLADAGSDQSILRAEHYVTRGDLFWMLANAPEFPQATTRPALAVRQSTTDLLTNAASDYGHVVDEYPKQRTAWTTAEMGLAAIAENRGNWDEAAKRYHDVQNRDGIPDGYKQIASARLSLLEQIRKPIQLGPLTTMPSTQSSSQPSSQASSRPATQPSTQASTQPSSQPSSQPSMLRTDRPLSE